MKRLSIILTVFLVSSVSSAQDWVLQNSGVDETLYSVCFLNPDTGYAVGDFGTIIKTTDGGQSWIIQYSGTLMPLYSVSFVNTNIGFVVGEYRTILKTTNGGLTWIAIESLADYYTLTSVFFIDENNG